jgi:hypothetical protein
MYWNGHTDIFLSGWLLLNAKSGIVQLYHGENKLHSMTDGDICFALDQRA